MEVARIRGVYLRKPPKGPSAYSSKEAALAASPTMLVADAAFQKTRLESVRNAAFRVNSGGRGEWSPAQFFAIWEYAHDVILRVSGESASVVGFVCGDEVVGEGDTSLGTVESVMKEQGVEAGGWVLLIGSQPHVPEGWEEVVSAPGSRKRKK